MLQYKNAVITGGSEGIGLSIAKIFAENGANLLLLSRDEEKLKKAKDELSGLDVEVHTLAVGLSDSKNLKDVAHQVKGIFSKVDILVNNVGVSQFVPFSEMDEKTLDLHLNLNVKAMYLLTRYLYGSIKTQKGNVLNLSSYFADRMLPGRASTAYSMTKGAVNSFTRSLAFEAGKEGVRVNAIAPGTVSTAMVAKNLEELSEEGKARFEEMKDVIYPLQRLGTTADIAEMALFLVSDRAKWITGAVMAVDGGLTTN